MKKIPKSSATECTKCGKTILPRWHHEGNVHARARTGAEPTEWFHKATGHLSCDPTARATPPDGVSRPLTDIPWKIIVHNTTGRIEHHGRVTLYLNRKGSDRVTEIIGTAMFETGGDPYRQWRILGDMIEDLYAGRHAKWLSAPGVLR